MRLVAIGVVCVVLATAGCGSGDGPDVGSPSGGVGSPPAATSSPPATPREGACGMVSDAELAAIVGRPIVDSKPGVAFSGPGCDWYDDQGGTVEMSLLTVTEYDGAKLGSTPLRMVTGIGEEAYLGSFDRVYVDGGERHLVVGTTAKVADGQVSRTVRDAAGPGLATEDMLGWEVSVRVARLVLDRV